MKIAVVGGGIAGLCLALNLLKKGSSVTLFDGGKGASHVAAGLLHPYVGEKALRNWRGKEALEEVEALLQEAQKISGYPILLKKGIYRKALTADQKQNLELGGALYKDVKKEGEDLFLITSGYLVDMHHYLDALLKLCKGYLSFTYRFEKVEDLASLATFDAIALCCGYGIRSFFSSQELSLCYTKGQVLRLKGGKEVFKLPYIAKGYVAFREDPEEILLGSTYEKRFNKEEEDMEVAKKRLIPIAKEHFPFLENLEPLGCLSGVRVAHANRNTPLIGKVQENIWALTALGSKGLLYHQYLAGMLALSLVKNDTAHIPEEILINSRF